MEKLDCSVYDVAGSIEEMIQSGATVPVYVSGNSMNPFLVSRRDIVYLKGLCEAELKKGMIILFRRNDGQLVLHRLHRSLFDGRLQVVGDGQVECETIDKAQVVAAVSDIERKGKKFSADSLRWKTAIFFWQLLMPLRPFIMRIWRKLRKIRRSKSYGASSSDNNAAYRQ
ncbi:MAG: S24/S26 family peptidase [Clostridia bacterium]|nr:S24/S26 family peptidase [Clostridia bacterium]